MKPETLGEVHIMFQNLLVRFDNLEHKMQENTNITEKVLAQATKTNGRVNIIEPLALDYQENRARARGMILLAVVMGATILTVGSFAVNSYINYKTQDITNSVMNQIDNKYDIQYEKTNTKTK